MVGAPRWNRHPVDLFWCCSSTFQTNHFSEVLKPLVPQWKCIRGCTTDSLYRHSQATWPFRPSSGPWCGDFSAHDSLFPWTEALLLKIVGQNYKNIFLYYSASQCWQTRKSYPRNKLWASWPEARAFDESHPALFRRALFSHLCKVCSFWRAC